MMSAVVDGKIYAIGGSYYNGSTLINVDTVEVLDLSDPTPVWDDAAVADLPEACSEGRAYSFDSTSRFRDIDGMSYSGKIVATCGHWPDENNRVYMYREDADRWESFPSLLEPRRDLAGEFIYPHNSYHSTVGVMGIWGGRSLNDTNVLTSTEFYHLQLAPCSVLLVDDDWNFTSVHDGGRPYYETALQHLGYPHEVWDTDSQGAPPATTLSSYDIVVWFTGYDWQTPITVTEETEIMSYLDQGGQLVLSSQELLYNPPDPVLVSDYLWIDVGSSNQDVVITNTMGNSADPLFAGLGSYTLVRPDDWDNYWPTGDYEGPYNDEIHTRSGGYEPTTYDTGAPNSTRYTDGNFKVVYFGYPLEWVNTVHQRAEVLGTAMSWMCQARDYRLMLPVLLKND
jgi:hypothetical protein